MRRLWGNARGVTLVELVCGSAPFVWEPLAPVAVPDREVERLLYKNVVVKRDGSSDLGMDSEATWLAQRAWYHTEPAPAKDGPWQTFLNNLEPTTYSTGWTADTTAGALYPSYFWAALTAAVERGVPGADAAWATVTSGVTGLSTWRSGFAAEPRWGAYPRNR